MPSHLVLQCVRLSKHFDGIRAIEDIDIEVRAGQVCALIGPNGAGKTTVLNVVSGLVRPDRGRVLHADRDITALPMWQVARSGVAFLFQDPRVFESLSVLENVMLAMPNPMSEGVLAGVFHRRRLKADWARQSSRAKELLGSVELIGVAASQAGELSFGQQRLLGFARALAMESSALLLDEPGAGLSPPAVRQVVKLIRTLAATGKAVLMVEHNMALVEAVADFVYYLAEGRLMVAGPPSDVLKDSQVRKSYLGL